MPKALPNGGNGGNGKGRPVKVIQKTSELLQKDEGGKGKGKEREIFGGLNRLIGGECGPADSRGQLAENRNEGFTWCNNGGKVCQGVSNIHFLLETY